MSNDSFVDEQQAKQARRRLRTSRAVIRARWLALALLVGFGAVGAALLVAKGEAEAVLDHALLLWVWSTTFSIGIAVVASHLVGQLKNHRDRLQGLLDKDAVTGLWGRGYFDRRLAAEVARASRVGRLFSVLWLRVPDFRRIAAERGYSFSDTALQAVAAQIRAAVPPQLAEMEALAARYDGGQFAVLLPEVGTDESKDAAERIRAALQSANAVVQADEVRSRVENIDLGDLDLRLTAGIATYGEHGVSTDELLQGARDAAQTGAGAAAEPVQLSSRRAAEIRWQAPAGGER